MALIVVMGAVGCVARWAIEEIVERRVLSHRPYATMAVNAVGSLVTGFVVYASYHSVVTAAAIGPGPDGLNFIQHVGSHGVTSAAPWLLTGFCGGFTTFSSAIAIPYLDWRGGRRLRAGVLVGLTPVLCVVGYYVGGLLTRIFFHAS